MNTFIDLTEAVYNHNKKQWEPSGVFHLNAERILTIRPSSTGSRVVASAGMYYDVVETPAQIFKLIRDESSG